ncbi:diguanylate cyclase [Alkaliphilus transvaalensis]|uniref:diguanylate cyclase n=1 Tax=Alkaliphilus transvaalensis TaxID=114628 RepID=UPI00047B2A4E|nr:diguanylate cyclase [Alkaliphilus transvaalensis]
MEIINNRYKIGECLEIDNFYSKYTASDLLQKNKKVLLYIIKDNQYSKTFIEYCRHHFHEISAINHKNIVSLYSCGTVETIDDKHNHEMLYFYTTEYFQPTVLKPVKGSLSKADLLQIYKQMANFLDFLHFHGMNYKYIDLENISITRDNGELVVKLMDLISLKKKEFDKQHEQKLAVNSRAPELYYGIETGPYTDIYSLGVLLYYFYTTEEFYYHKLLDEISLCSEKVQLKWELDFFNIIKNATQLDYIDRYQSIHQMNRDIEGLYQLKEPIEDKTVLETLNFKIPIIGRDMELKKIMSLVENWNKSLILIQGDKGIGKSRFINEVRHQMQFNKVHVFSTSILNDRNDFHQTITLLLRQVLRHAPQNIIDKYAEELVKIIPEIGFNKKITPSRELTEDREILRLYDRITNFIIETVGAQQTLLTFDDIHFADRTVIEFIDYFLKINRLKKAPIMILLGYTDELYHWQETHNYLVDWNNSVEVLKIKLSRLTVEETAKMIKYILGWFIEPLNFATNIMRETDGNPALIEEAIRELYAQKHIYVDYTSEKNGYTWHSNIEDYSRIKLPENFDESIYIMLNTFDDFTKKLLEIVSLFNTSVSLQILSKLLGEDQQYSPCLNRLTQLKILNEKLEDWGYTYGFYRSQLKTYIYESIQLEKRIQLHQKVSIILEDLYQKEGRENKEELIYHLFQSNQRNKAIDYCIEAGDHMFNLRIYTQAVVFYKRAYSLLKMNPDEKYLKLLIRMGEVYQNQGKNNEALESYKEVTSLTNGKIQELTIDAQCNIAQIYLNRNELKLAERDLKEILHNAEKIQYGEGLLKAAYLLARVYMHSKEVDNLEEVCEKYLEIAKKLNRFEYIGMFINQKGILEFLKGNVLQAKEYCEISVGFLEKGKRIEETSRPINNIGVILQDHFQKIEEARKYFEKSMKIAQQYHRMEDLFRAYNNIADCYMLENRYDDAIEVLHKNINLATEYEDVHIKMIGYMNLSECYLMIGDYKQSYNYLLKAESDIYNNLNRETYYKAMVNFLMTMGSFHEALEQIKNLKEYSGNNFISLLRIRLTEFMVKTSLGEAVEEAELLEILEEYREKTYSRDHRIALMTAVGYFYDKGKIDVVKELLKQDETLMGDFTNHYLMIKRNLYEGLVLEDNKKKILALEALIGKLHPSNDKEEEWKIHSSLGYAYFKEGDYYKATSYYLNALEVIQHLLNRTPDKYKKHYLMVENKYNLKQQLLRMESLIQRGTIEASELPKINKSLKLQDINLQDFFDISRFQELFQNPAFYELALQQYKSLVSIEVDDLEGLLDHLSNDVQFNLELLTKLAGKFVLATSGAILGVKEDGYEVIAHIGAKINVEKINHLLEKATNNKNGLLIMNQFNQTSDSKREYANKDIRASICLPIIQQGKVEHLQTEKRNWHLKDKSKISGYLYLETDKVFNNFSYETFKECKKLISLAYIMLNNYYLKIESSIDKMTGAYVRKYFEKLLLENIESAKEINQNLSIVMCDIDHFKIINDTYGHQRGDLILEEAGKVLQRSIRTSDFVGRYGGEEFIILLPGADKNAAYKIAEKIRISFEEAKLLGDEFNLTISCGVASFPEDGSNKEIIIEKADQALYNAKEQGRNMTVTWRNGMSFVDKRTDKLAGIVSGNIVQDQRNVLVLAEAIEILTEKRPREEKNFILLGRLIEILEAEEGILFLVENGKISSKFYRKRFVDNWVSSLNYNEKLIDKVIQTRQGEYLIDWEDISQIDIFTGTPNWKSVIVVPIIYNGDLKGVIYLSASVKEREFDFNAYNLAKITSSIMGPFMEETVK